MSSRKTVIESKDLSIGYLLKGGKVKLVHENINIRLVSGELTCLLGLNGVGKSTLLRTICGFHPVLDGEIFLQGRSLKDFSQEEFSLNVGVVLTEKTNAGGMTVYDLVSLGRHPYTGFFGQLKSKDHKAIRESLEAVGITHKSESYFSELSDGEKQKVMIAKVLAQECSIIILDEPTAFLDVTSRIETMILLLRLARDKNKAVLLSTHDIDLALGYGDSLWLLSKGKPIVCGPANLLIGSGEIGKAFDRNGIIFNKTTCRFENKYNKVTKNESI